MKVRSNIIHVVLFLVFSYVNSLGQTPSIDIWYGKTQSFGRLGTPQKQINILGRVSDPQGINTIDTLWYTLNGSTGRGLNWGDNGRRLEGAGDFNIEIFLTDADLNTSTPYPDTNEIIITATDENSNTTTDTVIVEYTGGVTWNSTYSVAWDTVTNIQNVVQVTDGKWEIVEYETGNYGIRIANNEYGYDRGVILGDTTWENYEITIKTKIIQEHPINGGVDVGSFYGIVPRWTGHTDNPISGMDPKAGWEPSGEFTGFALRNTFGSNIYQIGFNDINDWPASLDYVEYSTQFYTIRVQSDLDSNYYGFKWWLATDSEPSGWLLEGFIDNSLDAEKGSIVLLAHNIDGVFGDLSVSPLSALPVELLSFKANVTRDGKVLLAWETATEINNYGFEIERAIGAKINNSNIVWEKVGFIKGHGNSNATKYYSFADSPSAAGVYYYRLKQIDNDGTFEYSKLVETTLTQPLEFSLSQNYPNPFNPTTTINFSLAEESSLTLTVFDALGQIVEVIKDEVLLAGQHTATFNARNIASGTYIYTLEGNSINSKNDFRIINKMTVIK